MSRVRITDEGLAIPIPMSKWQPISTAPDDGARVLVIGGIRANPEIVHADGAWWRRRKAEGGTAQPTHWMPIPPLPEPPGAP